MLVKAGVFDSATVAGNQAIAGVGFKPKLVILFSCKNTADTVQSVEANFLSMFGAGTGPTERFAGSSWERNTSDPTEADRRFISTAILTMNENAVITMEADLASMDDDGFALNWTAVNGTARKIFYLAIGGDGVQVKIGFFNTNTTTGNQAVTGVGFKPQMLLSFLNINGTTEGSSTNHSRSMGYADTPGVSSTVHAFSYLGFDNVGTSDEQRGNRTAEWMVVASGSAFDFLATFVSMDADGFTFNIATAAATSRKWAYIAISGVRAKVIRVASPTANGTQQITGVGFKPLVLFFNSTHTSGTAFTGNSKETLGVATGPTNRFYTAQRAQGGQAAAVASHRQRQDKFIASIDGSVTSEADLQSMDADGFTLNWTTTDTSTRHFAGWALAESTEVLERQRYKIEESALLRVNRIAEHLVGA
jgi:hypothetical protein